MKLEKLLTLSQFIDELGSKRPYAIMQEPDGGMSEMSDCMSAVIQYNNFLKR